MAYSVDPPAASGIMAVTTPVQYTGRARLATKVFDATAACGDEAGADVGAAFGSVRSLREWPVPSGSHRESEQETVCHNVLRILIGAVDRVGRGTRSPPM